MKRASWFLKINIPALALLALLTASCTDVYFENPVPQRADRVRALPAEWAGLYVSEPDTSDKVSVLDEIFRTCFRIEPLETGRLLVSTEYRIHSKDMPRLKTALEEQKKEGKLLGYEVTQSFIFCTLKTERDGRTGVEEQFTTLLKTGDWYVLTQTIAPFWLFDVNAGRRLEFEPERGSALQSAWLPEADSVSVKSTHLDVRKKQQTWYFNTRKEEEAVWSLLCVEQTSKNELVVTLSNLKDRNAFEERLEYYNAITPFRKTGDNRYHVNPTDEALERLMKEENLFETIRLKKVKM